MFQHFSSSYCLKREKICSGGNQCEQNKHFFYDDGVFVLCSMPSFDVFYEVILQNQRLPGFCVFDLRRAMMTIIMIIMRKPIRLMFTSFVSTLYRDGRLLKKWLVYDVAGKSVVPMNVHCFKLFANQSFIFDLQVKNFSNIFRMQRFFSLFCSMPKHRRCFPFNACHLQESVSKCRQLVHTSIAVLLEESKCKIGR